MTSHTSPKPCPRCGVLRQARPTSWCRDCREVRQADNSWMVNAACRTVYNKDIFWPLTSDTQAAQPALAVCGTCDVVDDCLEYAMTNNETAGIWGGTTPVMRQFIRIQARKNPA